MQAMHQRRDIRDRTGAWAINFEDPGDFRKRECSAGFFLDRPLNGLGCRGRIDPSNNARSEGVIAARYFKRQCRRARSNCICINRDDHRYLILYLRLRGSA
jgi:hypothetical protein